MEGELVTVNGYNGNVIGVIWEKTYLSRAQNLI